MEVKVELKDGTMVPDGIVDLVRVSLDSLVRQGFPGGLALYEVGKLARDLGHKIFSQREFGLLRSLGLVSGTMEQPYMHELTRRIVACMVEFDGEVPVLVDPRKPAT